MPSVSVIEVRPCYTDTDVCSLLSAHLWNCLGSFLTKLWQNRWWQNRELPRVEFESAEWDWHQILWKICHNTCDSVDKWIIALSHLKNNSSCECWGCFCLPLLSDSGQNLLHTYETHQDPGLYLILKMTAISPKLPRSGRFSCQKTLLLPFAFSDDTEQKGSAGSPSKPED